MSRVGGRAQKQSLAGEGSNRSNSSRSSNTNLDGLPQAWRAAFAVQEVVDRARSVIGAYKAMEAGNLLSQEDDAGVATMLRVQLGIMLMAGIRGPCSSQCLCVDYASTMRQLVSACSKAVSAEGASSNDHSIIQEATFRGLPAMAAQLLDPTAGHRLEAVQEALLALRE